MTWRWSRSVAMAALVALALAGPARAQYFGQNKIQYTKHIWHSISSDHFEVYFDAGADSLAMRTLDLAEKTQSVFSQRFGHKLSKRIPIILYASHHEFSQTNITPDLIDGSTGGFTEALRDRVVVPFSGSYEDFRHVLVHELVHAYQFDMFYNVPGVSLLSGQGLFQVPLWFAEGMAEYFSLGVDPVGEMFCRDGTLTGYLPPLEWAGGYLVYKMGQVAVSDLVEKHGEERFRDMLRRMRQMRSFERAFQRTYGQTPMRFDQQWREVLRKRYWPTLARLDHPDAFAKRLTDHRQDESALNFWPSVSPQGDRVAYFSDRRQYTDVYLMSAFDGKLLRRVVRGERNVNFEAFPLLRTSIAWSPDGERMAFVAGSRGRDWIYIVDADDGKVLNKLTVPCEELSYPAWSPVSDSLVVLGLQNGRSDLWLVHATTGQSQRLTHDAWDEKEPTWSPDGRHITFASDRLAPVVLHPEPPGKGFGRYGIYDYDLATGKIELLLDTSGHDHAPAWSPDGRRLVFITDRSGAPNLALYDTADKSITQLTDLTGGVQSLSWSRHNDRLVFSAFDRGGYDIFAVQEPLTLDPVVARLKRNAPAAVLSLEEAQQAPVSDATAPAPTGALAASWPDSASMPDTSAGPSRRPDARQGPRGAAFQPVASEPPPWEGGGFPMPAVPPGDPADAPEDTSAAARAARAQLLDRGGAFALSDTVLGQPPAPYRWRLSPEAVQLGAVAASNVGFAGSAQFLFSDFLGDHSLYLAGDLFTNALSETNVLALYNVLPRRLDWSVGAFHFKNYFQSTVTSLGENLGNEELFSERSFGALVGWSYPFDRFRRVELQYTQKFVEEIFFAERPNGAVQPINREYRSASTPTIGLTGDHALWGASGPVNGSRWNVTYTTGLPLFLKSLIYHTATVDTRRYQDLSRGYSFATRVMAGVSTGRDAQFFRLGGYSTLRGFPDFTLVGTHFALTNIELRYPFIEQLGLIGPLPLGNLRLRGASFIDFGTVFSEPTKPRLWELDPIRGRVLTDPYFSFGTGVRGWLLGLPMKLDVAWASDLDRISRPRWHFSIGPEY